MEENYLLSVCGTQTVGGESEKIELETSASYVLRNGSRYITYKEYDPEHPDGHFRTTVKISPEQVVTVMKGGAENHHLVLEAGKRHKCEYFTPYGSMMLGVYTHSVTSTLTDRGGELKVSYSIDIESQLASSNELILQIKEAEGNVNGSNRTENA